MYTRVVHCKRSYYHVYVGRPSKWGNPFIVGRDGDRAAVVAKYREWILTRPDLISQLGELRGKILACWCAPKACHANVLAELADSRMDEWERERVLILLDETREE